MTVKVLICDDDNNVTDLVSLAASMNWTSCETIVAHNGQEALRLFEEVSPDLVVLDLRMPPPDGFEVCRRIRQMSGVPIIVLSAYDSTSDKVRALDLGADDYVVKPFDAFEFLARMRAILRRSSNLTTSELGEPNSHIAVGDLSLNTDSHEVFVKGEPVRLTTTEYRLLEEMARHPGQVMSHDALLRRVWGAQYEGEERYLKVFVQRLRRKLGDDSKDPQYIQTEWGRGYRLAGR